MIDSLIWKFLQEKEELFIGSLRLSDYGNDLEDYFRITER